MDLNEQKNNGDQQKQALMEANNLTFKYDDILNVSINRTLKKQYFDTRTYTVITGSQQAVSTWNSGVDLIDLRNSYLKFRLNINAPLPTDFFSFGSGSAMNLINEIKILSSSGVELARTQDANVYHKFTSLSRHSSEWNLSIGSVMGMGGSSMNNANEGYIYCIPLSELDPFFEQYDSKLLPANLASGLRIEITFEDVNKALFITQPNDVINDATAGNALSYVINDIEFRTECVTLADSAMAILNREASQNGLELTYDRIYTSSKITNTTEESIEVRKAVSLCKSMYCISIPNLTIFDQATDSFLAANFVYRSISTRLGNQYYPYQPLENPNEAYIYFLKNFNKLKSISDCSVSLSDFISGGSGMICNVFETDDTLNLSGLPVNSSRIVETQFTHPGGLELKTFVFMKYTALARASLTNVSVKI